MTHKLGFDRLPRYTIFTKHIKRFDSEKKVHQLLRIYWDLAEHHLRRPRSLVLDFDSTVETVYGDQEKSSVGYNPHKPGRPSYHPLLAYEGNTGLALNATSAIRAMRPMPSLSSKKPWLCIPPNSAWLGSIRDSTATRSWKRWQKKIAVMS